MVGHARDTAPGSGQFPQRRVILLGEQSDSRHRHRGRNGAELLGPSARCAGGARARPILRHDEHGARTDAAQHARLRTVGRAGTATRRAAAALLTDIGNDLLYEQPVERIVDWVGQCLDRLLAIGARVAISRLPVANLASLSELRFRILRRAMFPLGRLDFATITARAYELDQRIAELAESRGLGLVEQQTLWYGWDPIHIRRRFWPSAWRQMLEPWTTAEGATETAAPTAVEPARATLLDELYLRLLAPQERRWLGFVQRRPQPCGSLRDGTTISFY